MLRKHSLLNKLARFASSLFRRTRPFLLLDSLYPTPAPPHISRMASTEQETIKRVADNVLPSLKIKKLSENATVPTKGSDLAAGYDLVSAMDVTIPPRGKALAKTDIAMAIPHGCYGRIAPRSGLAWKHHIDIGAGVIDADYRGNVGVVMFNLADKEFKVEKGMRIAQLILERYEWNAVIEEVDDLDDTVRGSGGYGSTGMKVDTKEDAPKKQETEDAGKEEMKEPEAVNRE